jgi:hypothetical protein
MVWSGGEDLGAVTVIKREWKMLDDDGGETARLDVPGSASSTAEVLSLRWALDHLQGTWRVMATSARSTQCGDTAAQ